MNTIHCVQVQPSYLLYAKPFRETSLLLEIFSRDYGRVSLVARGARGRVNSRLGSTRRSRPRFQGLLQPFVPLLLSWRGRGDLFNLTEAESNGVLLPLTGQWLIGGWYMNELLVHTLRHWDAQTILFDGYQAALSGLSSHFKLSLRQFEKTLLTTLGVLPQLDYDQKTGLVVEPQAWYLFCPMNGVTQVVSREVDPLHCFQGAMLLALQQEDWQRHPEYLPAIRHLFRVMLDHFLPGRAIRSRDLLPLSC